MSGAQRVVFLDGQFLPAAWARVRADDRGLLFGDGLFETFCAFNQRVYLLERHIRRLRDSAAALGIAFPAYLDSADELVAQLC
ncbi:MAG: aminotransferase class IV, partial [Candidatus Alcyoniella australis]|nr:aminotransferase class IV [Candidatus Alcyoniella australis]